MSLSIFLITLAFIILLQSAIPFLLKGSIVFGVTIPEQHMKERAISSYKRFYSATILITGFLALIVYFLWAKNRTLSEDQVVFAGLAIQFGILFLCMIMYLYFHAKTTKLKRTHKWGAGLKPVRIADLASHAKDEMLPSYMFALPALITAGLLVYTASQYSQLPAMIPTHWDIDGQPDAFSQKTSFSAISLLLILLVIQGMLFGINVMTKRSGIKLTSAKKKSSQVQQLAFRKYSSWFLFFTTVLITILFGFIQLVIIQGGMGNAAFMAAVPLGFLSIMLIVTAVYAFKVGQGGSRIQVTAEEEETMDTTFVDDDQYWKAGIFYVNKNDPSIFVEKRFGVGWAINFGNPIGYIFLLVSILLILLISFFI
ncbi:hypothetical protein AS888_05255 [Peribacillus simplex]|uniref:DUF1648 domain-containing protein n=1 Tax=Peribacillus simplex TaxID=1478 RepID=A0A109N1R4_9BACI|nr:DUF5808 domain-containing protein [Peribacillus simplex]KWW21895.1 hypothetical protein AS888_05255 [Peribacillus simplex]